MDITAIVQMVLSNLPAIVNALKEAGEISQIAYEEFEQFNTILTMAQNGQLTTDYLNTLDVSRQTSYQNVMAALVAPPV